jgi:hypothetical protein
LALCAAFAACPRLCIMQEHARDSFENLLFSLCRFHEITGRYPAHITAVSYTLKQKRFEQLHRAAVRFPVSSFSFVGTEVSSCTRWWDVCKAARGCGKIYSRLEQLPSRTTSCNPLCSLAGTEASSCARCWDARGGEKG